MHIIYQRTDWSNPPLGAPMEKPPTLDTSENACRDWREGLYTLIRYTQYSCSPICGAVQYCLPLNQWYWLIIIPHTNMVQFSGPSEKISRPPLTWIPGSKYSDQLTYNNHAFMFREELCQQCIGCRAVHCSTNSFNCPQDKTECDKHCSIWHGSHKPVKQRYTCYVTCCNSILLHSCVIY